jgi:tetratricopeptide (TPR) repeat protein
MATDSNNNQDGIVPSQVVIGALVAAGVLVVAGVLYILRHSPVEAAMIWAGLVFILGSVGIVVGTLKWLGRVDQHLLLRSEEKIQNKDALVIGAFFSLLLLLAYCIVAAAAAMLFPQRGGAAVLLALTWALASVAVGGAFGFLLGHPRRLTDEKTDRAGISGLLRTGLDDMVDWLVKGLTTVLLVQAGPILVHLGEVSKQMGRGLVGPEGSQAAADAAATFAQPLVVAFTLLGALATCLVTRTYLTGALSRADRTTIGAFGRVGLDLGEVLLLTSAQRFLTTRNLQPGAEVRQVAERLSALSLSDLHSVQEFAMWAKAKSMLGKYDDALKGYEKAVAECDCDASLLLNYAVALHGAKKKTEAIVRLEEARDHLARATDVDTRRNIYKSLTFELLYEPGNFDRVLKLVDEYERDRQEIPAPPSGGLIVNKACAWGQRFMWIAKEKALIDDAPTKPVKVLLGDDPSQWLTEHEDLREAFYGALDAVKTAIRIDPTWKRQLQLLLRRFDPRKSEHPDLTDLEVFERFNAFRAILDLPPFSEAAAKAGAAPEEAGREATGNAGKNIGTGQGEMPSKAPPQERS